MHLRRRVFESRQYPLVLVDRIVEKSRDSVMGARGAANDERLRSQLILFSDLMIPNHWWPVMWLEVANTVAAGKTGSTAGSLSRVYILSVQPARATKTTLILPTILPIFFSVTVSARQWRSCAAWYHSHFRLAVSMEARNFKLLYLYWQDARFGRSHLFAEPCESIALFWRTPASREKLGGEF